MRVEEIPVMLKFCREFKGLTQLELAAELHKDRAWISRVENGQVIPDVGELIAWSVATNGGEILGRVIAQACGASDVGYQEVIEARNIKQMVKGWAAQMA